MIPALQNLQQYLSTLSPAQQVVAKSYLLNIFQLNPWLSRFYADSLDLLAANPQQINNLQTRSVKKIDPDPKGPNPMALNQNVRICTHIKVNGVRCGSPALRSEVFCYFHQRMIRGVRTPPKSRLHPVAQIENEEGIQASLMEVIDALIRNTIDLRRANLILRALHIAARNSPRVHFGVFTDKMVHEVPQYPAPPAAAQPPAEALAQAGALAEIPRPKPVSSKPAKIAAPAAAAVTPKPPVRIPPAPARALPPRAATPPRNAALQ
jgi:hypothetical protein